MFELENEFDLIDLDDKENRFSQVLLRIGGLLLLSNIIFKQKSKKWLLLFCTAYKVGASNGNRTRDLSLTKAALYLLSYGSR